MSITPDGVQIGPLTLSFFGLIVVAALAVGGGISWLEARRRGEDPAIVLDALTWGLLFGVIAARLFYVWNPPPSVAAYYDRRWYLTHLFDLQAGPLAIWSGGLGMAGALAGGLLGVYLWLRRRRVDVWRWADILTPGALAGLTISAWANLVNRQMYGPPTDLPWGMVIAHPVPPYDVYPPGTRFHPTPAYLSLWALIVLGIVWGVRLRWKERLRQGELSLLATLLYTPGLFLADFLRVDVNHGLLGLTGTQALALLLFGGAGWLLWRRRTGGSPPVG